MIQCGDVPWAEGGINLGRPEHSEYIKKSMLGIIEVCVCLHISGLELGGLASLFFVFNAIVSTSDICCVTFNSVAVGVLLQKLTQEIGKAKREQKAPLEGVAAEAFEHLSFAEAKSSSFYGREDLVSQVSEAIIAGLENQGPSAVVVHGFVLALTLVYARVVVPIISQSNISNRQIKVWSDTSQPRMLILFLNICFCRHSGCGKTALLSKCLKDVAPRLEKTNLIIRFLGTSPITGNAKTLIIDLW